jgi:DNA-binding beta-propeller fold protein YncE
LLIALDDRDEIAEASVDSLKILRRVKVPGMPYGLAVDPAGDHLFVTCKHDHLVRVLELRLASGNWSVQVGMGPVAIAFCRTSEGDRLVVANSMSDDISIVGVSPLKELSRLTAGREPFAGGGDR